MIWLFAPSALALSATVVIAAIARRMAPSMATRLISAAIAAVFVSLSVSSWVIAVEFLIHEPLTGRFFDWCGQALAMHNEPWRLVGLPALALALWTSARAMRIVRAWRNERGHGERQVEVVELATPIAHAQPGRNGGVVVSTGMLKLLDSEERDALLSHERSHLEHRHDRFLVLASLASALPVLLPAVHELRHALERWADEDAALAVGDRRTVARAVAKAAIASHEHRALLLAMAGADVPARVEALLLPVPQSAGRFVWVTVAAAMLVLAAAGAGLQLHHLTLAIRVMCPG